MGEIEKVYIFDHLKIDDDIEEAKRDAASAAAKFPALVEVVKFIFDGCHGLKPEIKEKTIDDAFDCMIDRDKVFIKTSRMSKEEKTKAIADSEYDWNLRKGTFKSSLTVKETSE